jgi:hypothetical protein
MANISELHLPDGTTKIIEDGTLWSGHRAAWEALTTEEQSKYRFVMIDNDSETGETVDEVTDGDMRAVTSNAVADGLQKTKMVYGPFSGKTDDSGNVLIRAYNSDYIPIFASVNQSNYTCYVFFWKENQNFYAHVIKSTGEVAPKNLSVTGYAYFLKVENMEPIS